MEQMPIIREMIQKKMPDKKVQTVFYIAIDLDNNILYGINGSNKKLLGVAKISPFGEVEIIK